MRRHADRGRLAPFQGVRVSTIAAAPFTARARRELVFCLAGVALGLGVPAPLLGVASVSAAVADSRPRPAVAVPVLVGAQVTVLLVLIFAPRIGRWLGAVHRWLAARLLGAEIPAPPRRRLF